MGDISITNLDWGGCFKGLNSFILKIKKSDAEDICTYFVLANEPAKTFLLPVVDIGPKTKTRQVTPHTCDDEVTFLGLNSLFKKSDTENKSTYLV